MSPEKTKHVKKTYKDYMDLIDVVCKVEYKRLTNNYMVDFAELQNIAILTVHTILTENDIETRKDKVRNILNKLIT